jgi:hypothetical protein
MIVAEGKPKLGQWVRSAMFRRAVVRLVVVPGAAALADRLPTRDHIGRHRMTEAEGVNALPKGVG